MLRTVTPRNHSAHQLEAEIAEAEAIRQRLIYLEVEANKMGLNTRGMGGIDLDAAYDAAGVPRDTFESICAIAVGTRGTDDDLHPRIVEQNFANSRKPVEEVAFKGRFSE